ncbi:hypothetical protein GCM10009775_05710 [Microbacterium aoyamense]|uniref:Uncharacterized protein n=1 Tax=Microbacterium aoyamense TaxID=344166 RepID=A0ABP5AME0_9MICO|nr:hypothetical protein [Microbacterium aoyamense]
MTDTTEVGVETLRRAAHVLFDRIEELSGPTVELDVDMFWAIPPEQRNDVHSTPTEFTIGQLSRSLAEIESLAATPDSAITYALVWLADACARWARTRSPDMSPRTQVVSR